MDVTKAINEIKAGKVEYRLDKTNIIHCPIGKVSFGAEKLAENFNAIMGAIVKASPPPPRASISRAAWWLPPWAPALRSTAPSWCDLIPIRSKYIPSPNGLGIIVSGHFHKPKVFSSTIAGGSKEQSQPVSSKIF